jgi:AcrR family transcriptional regulator
MSDGGKVSSPAPRLGTVASPLDGLSRSGAFVEGQSSGPERVLEIQRSRLLAAMVEVSAERGSGNVTVAHIVARAGVSRRTFYELYPDGEACFLDGFDEGIARASRYVLDTYSPSANWVERLRKALVRVLSLMEEDRDLARLLVIGSLGAGAEAVDRRRRVLAHVIAFVDEGRKETKTAPGLPVLTAEGIVGGVLSVLHSRLLYEEDVPLLELAGPLMSMIVLPYIGSAAARRELARPIPPALRPPAASAADPLRHLGMRLTYRTVRVLLTVAATPGGSNRQVADGSGIGDQGQISKLLARLQGLGLIENTGAPAMRGAPNSWVLTDKGWEVQGALARNAA